MTRSHILRLPCGDAESGNFVLEAKSNGSKPLDLLIRGTDGASAFETKTRHNRIKEFKAANAPCSEAEWEQILLAILVDPQGATRAQDIEIKVELSSDEEVTLHFRKNIQGIAQRLGTIKLKELDETEDNPGISPFDWCIQILEDYEKVVQEVGATKALARELEQSVEELKGQLEDLLKAKEGDESVLLEKFRDLLNEKKLKIRQQQKVIESAEVDPEKLQNVGASQHTMRKAGGSRTSKRKIKDEPLSDEESDGGFEKMDVDDQNSGPQQDSDTDERQTTDNDATESEPDNNKTDAEEEEAPAEPAPNKSKPARSTRSRATKGSPAPSKPTRASTAAASRSTRASQKQSEEPTVVEADDDVAAPPPVRTLPFKSKANKPAPAPVADDETESDDEL
ncbi:Mitotic apparatus protein p62-like protein [Apiospora aurea]|uniref:Mitotic apparatus protein p62-like protein n=1 Tax=Apiospora aurea TaxID=335848 RepID=A0ABR1Q9K6_9PEZI